MYLDAAEAASGPLAAAAPVELQRLPRWLRAIDAVVIAVLNVSLVLEVILIFAGTMARALFNSSALLGIDETSPPFLVTIAFAGGAIAYSRGQFIAITVLVDRAPPAWKAFCKPAVEWLVLLVSVLLGVYSVPLMIANAEETSVLLGISSVWSTLPITIGSALFVLHAGVALLDQPRALVAAAGAAVAAAVLAFVAAEPAFAAHSGLLYASLVAMFLALIAIGLPIGFVLAIVGIGCVEGTGSTDMVAVVMNAQRGSGGFIFLALPFFVLAGFIMDRADVGSRIVEFVGSLIGHVRGGLLQVMVIGMYIASCISGSKAADMATIGLPMNRKLDAYGYEPHERAALLAASAAMAESVPPSIALILMGSATAISTGALFIAGLLPAATIAACLMVLVRVRASCAGWQPAARASRAEIFRSARQAVLPMMMPVILIGGIAGGIGTPTEVSTFAVLYGFALGLLYGKLSLRNFWSVLTRASLLNGMIFFTVSAAMIFSWALTLEGVTTALADTVASLGAAAFLPAVIVITACMGALLESFVTIIMLAPLLLPVAQQLGVQPLQYGIVMTEAFGIGIVLPPIGIALYVACAICGAKVERASKPLVLYLLVIVAGLMLVAAVPWITAVLPASLGVKG